MAGGGNVLMKTLKERGRGGSDCRLLMISGLKKKKKKDVLNLSFQRLPSKCIAKWIKFHI